MYAGYDTGSEDGAAIDGGETDIQTVWMVRADAVQGRDYDLDRLTWLWDVTTRDDERIIRNKQQHVISLHYRPGPLSEMERGIADCLEWHTGRIG